MGLAWGVGFSLSKYFFLREQLPLKSLYQLSIGLFTCAWIGAKVYFLLFSAKDKLQQYLYADYFWLGGGFVFYGGLIGGLLFFLFYSLFFKKIEFAKASLLTPGLVFGHAIGRIGCLLTGCCYGTHCNLPWAVKVGDDLRHPVQFYEAFALFWLGVLLFKMATKKKNASLILAIYLFSYSLIRFALEFFRGDEIRGIYWMNLSTSQWTSIAMFLLAILFFLKSKNYSRI